MNSIIQLTEYEYNQLKKQADATRETINKAVAEEVKKLCNLELEVKMAVGLDWNDTFSIKPYASLGGNWVFGTDAPMDLDAALKIGKKVQKWMQEQIEGRYGFGIEQVNRYTKANKNRWKWMALWTILSASGWMAAITTWLL